MTLSVAEPVSQILVIGTGLIGTSAGLALTDAGYQVWLEDADAEAVRTAISKGAGNSCPPRATPDVVVVAVPPDAVASVVIASLARFPDATVTDVASVKAAPLASVAAAGADVSRYVGGHPMAGLEVSGAAAGRSDLFEDRIWVVTPTGATDPQRVATVRTLAQRVGAVPIEIDPKRHDHAVALTSHTPQVLSSLLAAQLLAEDEQDVVLSGQGLRDLTRLASSSPTLWSEILAGNATEVAQSLVRIRAELDAVIDHLSESLVSREALAEVISRGNRGRAVLPDKHGGEAHTYTTIPVVVADQPGELARLFAAAGAVEVNLEDVRIEHTVGRLRAIVELDVRPDAAARLRDALSGGGWTLRG